jgi:hypothetical protein
MFIDISFAIVREAVMAFPEVMLSIFVGGLFIGWGISWLLAHRELKVNRSVIAAVKKVHVTPEAKRDILQRALPQRRLPPILRSFGLVLLAGAIAGVVTLLLLPKPQIWQLTDSQRQTLAAAMAKEPKKIDFMIIAVPGSPSAFDYSFSLMSFMGYEKGWSVGVIPYDAYHSAEDPGLRIATKIGVEEKNENAVALKRIFEALGFKIPFVGDPRITTNDGVYLIIGKHP